MLITLTKRVFWYQVAVFYSTQMLCTVYFVLRVSIKHTTHELHRQNRTAEEKTDEIIIYAAS
jgi:hypothetical protein